jgi:hypothetical protein
MKKVKWSSSLFLFAILTAVGCSSPESGNQNSESGSTMRMAAPLPGSSLEATGVHEISYGVMKFLANNYLSCNCNPNLDSLFFGSFIDTASVRAQLNQANIEGVYLHLGLTAGNEFYIGLSGASGIADSTLKAEVDYPIATDPYVFEATSFDDFMDNETFKLATPGVLKGSAIEADRQRFANTLTCDLNGDGSQDALATVPFGFVNKGELEELLDQCSSPSLGFIMGFDPTMYPSVMRVMMLSTKMHGAIEIKMVKMDPSDTLHYALFLDRQRP